MVEVGLVKTCMRFKAAECDMVNMKKTGQNASVDVIFAQLTLFDL